jgi:hypothetical protein
MSFDLQLAGKRVLVTGGTRGIGAAVVELMAHLDARIVATALSKPKQPIDGVHYVAANLATAEGVHQVVEASRQQLDGIDILINVVGGSSAPAGGFAKLDDAEWTKALDLNLMSAVRMDRALLPAMIAQGSGVILHVTSIQRVLPLHDCLCRCKGGTVHLQQGAVQGGHRQGRACGPRLAGLGRDRSVDRFPRRYRGQCGDGLRRRKADGHGCAGRNSAGTSGQAERSGGSHRVLGLTPCRFCLGFGAHDRRRHRADGVSRAPRPSASARQLPGGQSRSNSLKARSVASG